MTTKSRGHLHGQTHGQMTMVKSVVKHMVIPPLPYSYMGGGDHDPTTWSNATQKMRVVIDHGRTYQCVGEGLTAKLVPSRRCSEHKRPGIRAGRSVA